MSRLEDWLLNKISKYYDEKLRQYGPTPMGVDWNSDESQKLRFEQLLKILDGNPGGTLLDYGCGYGALLDSLRAHDCSPAKYVGFDISNDMIDAAVSSERGQYGTWKTELEPGFYSEYLVASGIFNVKLESPADEWLAYILKTLESFNQIAKKGFSFNVLTSYSDAHLQKDYLYYADPLFIFDHCKRKFSNKVSLIHDYALYEFTILVRK